MPSVTVEMLRLALLACLLPALAHADPVAGAPAPPAVKAPANVAGLFRDGASWKLPYKLKATFTHAGKRGHTSHTGTMTCSVDKTGTGAGTVTDELSCDREWDISETAAPLVIGPVGTWVATPGGLYGDSSDDASQLTPEQQAFAASPRAFRTKANPDGTVRYVRAFGKGWCFGRDDKSEDAVVKYGWMLCVQGGELVGGHWYSSSVDGSETKDASWGKTP